MATTVPMSSKAGFRHKVRALGKDTCSIDAAARTVSLAFDEDPLVTWLRRGAPTWGTLSPQIMLWQRRRLARARLEGLVVHVQLSRDDQDGRSSFPGEQANEDKDFGGVAILYPPPMCSNIRSTSRLLWFKLKDWWNPAVDAGSNMERVRTMYRAHDHNMRAQSSLFTNKPIWYLEVCCSRISVQGKGVGRALMEWVEEQIKDSACLLECTDEKNIPFYQKFGYRVVEIMKLKDDDDVVRIWLMVKN